MLYFPWIVSIGETIILTIPVLLSVAFVTVAERKTMASMQRRLGPNIVGYYGLLQAFADAAKLLFKEYVSPTQANLVLFFLGPIVTLVFSLLGYAVIPYAPGLAVSDFNLGILYLLAVSSLATYGILIAGWSANSKYAFLGSIRSTAQLISYELVLSSAILIVIIITNSLNLTTNIEFQKSIWLVVPLFPIFCMFLIGAIAETNRAPFDLAEAESELVSGFMTEHSAVVFVFFFLAEYASIVLICILTSILFLGGYLVDYYYINLILEIINNDLVDLVILILMANDTFWSLITWWLLHIDLGTTPLFNILGVHDTINIEDSLQDPVIENALFGFIIGFKTSVMIFVFIWIRASFPRIRFDQLMSYCWTIMLPVLFSFILLTPCVLYVFNINICNFLL